jgi:hypothetical protein
LNTIHGDKTLCDKVCEWLATGLLISLGTPISATKLVTEIFLKVALNTTQRYFILYTTYTHLEFMCLTPLSKIFQLLVLWRKLEYPEKSTDLSQVTHKLYHIMFYRHEWCSNSQLKWSWLKFNYTSINCWFYKISHCP